jgi:hypothetical protein
VQCSGTVPGTVACVSWRVTARDGREMVRWKEADLERGDVDGGGGGLPSGGRGGGGGCGERVVATDGR